MWLSDELVLPTLRFNTLLDVVVPSVFGPRRKVNGVGFLIFVIRRWLLFLPWTLFKQIRECYISVCFCSFLGRKALKSQGRTVQILNSLLFLLLFQRFLQLPLLPLLILPTRHHHEKHCLLYHYNFTLRATSHSYSSSPIYFNFSSSELSSAMSSYEFSLSVLSTISDNS